MPRPLDGAVGERLELSDYYADFRERYARANEFWKLERGQVYAEPNDESWKAFDRGDWEESLRILEKDRADLIKSERARAARGMVSRRVRIVTLPPTEYLQWELHALKMQYEVGELIRVVLDGDVAGAEDQGLLPDINVIGVDVVYRVMYDDNGVVDHAIRYTDEAVVRRCRDLIVGLYERGEPIDEFFRREIAPLPPPRPARQAVSHDYWEVTGRPQPPGR